MTIVAAEEQRDKARVFIMQLAPDLLKRTIEPFRMCCIFDDMTFGEAARSEHLDILCENNDAACRTIFGMKFANVGIREKRAADNDGHDLPANFLFRDKVKRAFSLLLRHVLLRSCSLLGSMSGSVLWVLCSVL